MYWWIKDVFVERAVHPEQQQYHRQQVRVSGLRQSWSNLKHKVKSYTEQQRAKQKVRHSYEALSKLNDHYLSDIGLRRIDLNVVADGSYPGHYQQNAISKINPKRLKVVSGKNRKILPKQDSNNSVGHYEKAA